MLRTMSDRAMPHREAVARVVIAGGGIAALEAVLALRAVAGDRVDIEIWTTERDFVYRPLAVATPFLMGEVRSYPLDRLVSLAGGRLRDGRVTAVDAGRHVVHVDADEVAYDILLLALGARSTAGIEGATTFRGHEDEETVADVIGAVVTGHVRRLVFALPQGPSRPLPLYELALETRSHLSDRGTRGVEVTIVTPERSPLEIFGAEASEAVLELLETRGIEIVASAAAERFAAGELHVCGRAAIQADAVIAMAQLEGQRVPGVPCDASGFVPTDDHGRVPGLRDVFAAGDMTSFPIKQGGIATQQADAAAAAIASDLGIPVEPAPFRPVVRGQLLTGIFPRYLRSDASGVGHVPATQAPWWPPAKIVGRQLTPFLAAHLGLGRSAPPAGAVDEGVELERRPDGTWGLI
jgi:sulfide:quinone oxidoreductase